MLTSQQRERFLSVSVEHQRISTILAQLRKGKDKIEKEEKLYYDEEKDKQNIRHYYCDIDFKTPNNDDITQSLEQLLQETHTKQVRYNPSEYVYPWVDLRPDGNLISVYSGKTLQPEEVIREDYATSLKRKEEMERTPNLNQNQLKQIESDFKYNCEHSVPQSWFNEQEPMRGDIHHLFTCEPVCNSIRSNYPYHDFTDYTPERIKANRIEKACGKALEDFFEPEYGKGTVARAMLYFLVRYPDQMEQSHRKRIDIKVLLDWHQNFPPELYEKHRNQAIYEIQGNRNPFIDFPKEMNQVFLRSNW